MAYFDTRKTIHTETAGPLRSIFDHLVKFAVTRVTASAKRATKSPQDLVAAQRRVEAHRRAVDRLMR